jgi:hypothetical protein
VLGYRYVQREVFLFKYRKTEEIDRKITFSSAVEEFNKKFAITDTVLKRNFYVLIVDTSQVYYLPKKLIQLDSMAKSNENIDFFVATKGENRRIIEYLKKYNLEFQNLKFISNMNYLHSAICNIHNSNISVHGVDLVFNSSGKILLDNFALRKNDSKRLFRVIDSINTNQWRKKGNILK